MPRTSAQTAASITRLKSRLARVPIEVRSAAAARALIEGNKEFASGLTGLAKALNDAKSGEGDLAALLEANDVKYRDRNGQVISTNEALGVAADLISRAATEADKVAIPEKVRAAERFSSAAGRRQCGARSAREECAGCRCGFG